MHRYTYHVLDRMEINRYNEKDTRKAPVINGADSRKREHRL